MEKFAFVIFVTCENENSGALVYLQLLACFYICPICLSFAIPAEHQLTSGLFNLFLLMLLPDPKS